MARAPPALGVPFHADLASRINAVGGFFAKLTKRRLKPGVIRSIVDLQAAIKRCIVGHNQSPKPFVRRSHPNAIIAARRRGFPSAGANPLAASRRTSRTSNPPRPDHRCRAQRINGTADRTPMLRQLALRANRVERPQQHRPQQPLRVIDGRPRVEHSAGTSPPAPLAPHSPETGSPAADVPAARAPPGPRS